MTLLKVPAALNATGINGYSTEGDAAKAAFHKQGKAFLKKLADALPNLGGYSIRSNLGGMAVSGEVTLHSDDLYVQLSESCMSPGVSMLYRSCSSRKDYCGNRNHSVNLRNFMDPHTQESVLQTMQQLVESEQDRKEQQTAQQKAACWPVSA